MQAAPQNNNVFAPVHEAHSIEQVIFVLQYDRPVNDEAFKQILDISAAFEEHLPAKSQLVPQFSISFGTPSNFTPNFQNGISYRRISPNGTLDTELRIERHSITYVTTNYTRWNPTWQKAKEYLDQLIGVYVQHARINAISLNYVDKYVWKGASEDFQPRLLINDESQFISRNIFSTQDFWHSHTGAFYKINDTVKRLLNFNVDAIEEPIEGKFHKVISLTTVITDMLDQPGYALIDYDQANLVEFVDHAMQSMHDFSKTVLTSTLTLDVQKQIGLAQ